MTIYRDRAVFERLADLTQIPETSRSAYWNFEAEQFNVGADGRVEGETVLGSVSAKKGRAIDAAHWVLQAPFRWFPSGLVDRAAIERRARRVADAQDRHYTHDMMRQALSISFARQSAPRGRTDTCNLVIGDGYGVLGSVLFLDDPGVKTICINLTKSLLIDVTRIAQTVPSRAIALVETPEDVAGVLDDTSVEIIAVRADDAACLKGAPIGAAFNVVSMQEMPNDVVAGYFDLLRSSTADRVFFYCCNKLMKRMPDGEEIRFRDYPWRGSDTTVAEGPCPWSQWVYDKKPPFWHHRSGEARVIWHRLAQLEKD